MSTEHEERMMKWFAYEHLPEHLQGNSLQFLLVAQTICATIKPGPERTVALHVPRRIREDEQ